MTDVFTVRPRSRRASVATALTVITAASWAYLILLAARMHDMGSSLSMPMTASWSRTDLVLIWSMWAVMMAAMMLPSAASMVVGYSATLRSDTGYHHGSTSLFVAGYLAAWAAVAAIATGAQRLLHGATLVNPMGSSTSNWLGGLLLVGAGVYQFTPMKDACLRQCRSPLGFLLNHWRNGRSGALTMGLHHGALCIGCCWALMAMLFVLGVMNLWWVALVAAVVLLEKRVPSEALTRLFGASLVLWGVALTFGAGG